MHLAYLNPKPIFWQWTILPRPGAPETWFQECLELNTGYQGLSQLSIGKLDRHSAALLPHYGTCVHIHCRLYWDQYWMPTWYFGINNLPTIIHVFLNLRCNFDRLLFVLDGLCEVFWFKPSRWAHISTFTKFITVLIISLTCNHWNKYISIKYNQFYLVNQNLH